MSEIISFPLPAGPTFTIPDVGEINWGQEVTNFLVAIPSGVMPTAGTFTLTGDVSLGPTFGLVGKYFTSQTSNPAASGFLKLAKTDTLSWRNNANNGDLPLGIDSSDNLTFNGSTIQFNGTVNPGTANQLAYYPASANAVSGLTAITPSRALQSNGSGLPIASTTTSTELGFVSGVTSAIQTQINSVVTTANAALPKSGGTMTGDINMGSHTISNLANGVNPQDAATVAQLPSVVIPVGLILPYGGSSAPSGWILCDGSAINRTTFSALFAVIGTTFGAGNGTTTFNVPSMANNVPIGAGSIAALGATTGSQTHVISSSELPTHNHTINDPGHAHILKQDNSSGVNTGAIHADAATNVVNSFPAIASNTTGITINNAGSSVAMSLVQPSIGVTYIIKA